MAYFNANEILDEEINVIKIIKEMRVIKTAIKHLIEPDMLNAIQDKLSYISVGVQKDQVEVVRSMALTRLQSMRSPYTPRESQNDQVVAKISGNNSLISDHDLSNN